MVVSVLDHWTVPHLVFRDKEKRKFRASSMRENSQLTSQRPMASRKERTHGMEKNNEFSIERTLDMHSYEG